MYDGSGFLPFALGWVALEQRLQSQRPVQVHSGDTSSVSQGLFAQLAQVGEEISEVTFREVRHAAGNGKNPGVRMPSSLPPRAFPSQARLSDRSKACVVNKVQSV
ncbi:hypothetical protein N657DRAFT_208944 [Parathielavia appendiculata]|uniref:Uncharacterized protein n=1 Tax=Parathielavia appendiculata TaxID=2587402 RepID=A0AAN6Z6X9_9PEZI|nr:hypothetical protein N657DRAFT_208944 [Parathielavia appendiculata]